MPKKRLNVTVDESVHEEITSRDDVNVSGLVNNFLKRYLRGEEQDHAAEKLRAERLEREAEEKMEEAQSLKQQAESIRAQFEEKKQKQEKVWGKAVNTLGKSYNTRHGWSEPDPSDRKVQFWADKIGITAQEFSERFPDKAERYYEDDEDTSSRQYQ